MTPPLAAEHLGWVARPSVHLKFLCAIQISINHPQEGGMSKGDKPKSGGSTNVFDVTRLREIIELMEEHQLGEVDLQQGEEKIRLSRVSSQPAPIPVAAPVQPAPIATPAAAAGEASSGSAGSPSEPGVTIDAPMVGTFYSRPNPESEPFVKVGDRVGPDTVVCIVEAMKVFNEIPAEVSGEVIEVLLSDGQAVDFGKPMVRVRPAS